VRGAVGKTGRTTADHLRWDAVQAKVPVRENGFTGTGLVGLVAPVPATQQPHTIDFSADEPMEEDLT
jgi:hypothetical protein